MPMPAHVWRKLARWGATIWLVGALASCGVAGSSAPVSPSPVFTPAPTATLAPGATPVPTASATPPPRPTPTLTGAPRAEVIVTLAPCDWTFGDPFQRERQIQNALVEPGILEVSTLGEDKVRVIYDPAQLTEAKAVETFAAASGLLLGNEHCP